MDPKISKIDSLSENIERITQRLGCEMDFAIQSTMGMIASSQGGSPKV